MPSNKNKPIDKYEATFSPLQNRLQNCWDSLTKINKEIDELMSKGKIEDTKKKIKRKSNKKSKQ